MSGYVVGADIGTSALKASLVHPDRGVVAVAERTYPLSRPHRDWAENDPDDWLRALAAAVPEVLAAAGVSAADVCALCLVGQRDIAVLLDEDGEVLTPCIHWTDRRDLDESSELYDRLGRRTLVERSGTHPIPGLVLANLVWTQRHLPDVWRRARHALQPKDYLAYRLTGDIGTDPSSPTRSLLNDWRTGDWSQQTCDDARIPREMLPEVKYQPWEPRGTLGSAAAVVGLLPGTVLVAGGGDDPAAALGSGVVNCGDVSIGTGSSMSWRVVADQPIFDPSGLVGLMPHLVPGRYLHEMVATGTGTTLRWFRSVFGQNRTYEQLIAAGADVPPGSDGLLCFPYVEGASVPVQDDTARAVYYGIGGHHTHAHFTRATLEGIAYQYPGLLGVLRDRGHRLGPMTISDGEARSLLWNQIKADVMGETITPSLRVEAPSIGAAILAGLGTDLFASEEEALAVVLELAPPVHPDPGRAGRYDELREHWTQVRGNVFPNLAR
ncbi:xylulokinase [Mycolicibacterium tokaiense]|uniref:Pentulose/hexulose kinase n=1 Tax=Mycolicibacterium tokaiense TaxID=39695 RepID=A0A378TDL0_9MYCO|nr:FGGY family carbohydrate kinase [Mycolicibacterium tokaiense]BBY86617.1 xylulokinase [Mycolicibacterium tokaiense]STZ58878.1 pentulose/hexulose kinase [Mycolicibacterium tokaiense]